MYYLFKYYIRYFIDTYGNTEKCDHLKCATCTSLEDCIEPCHEGC